MSTTLGYENLAQVLFGKTRRTVLLILTLDPFRKNRNIADYE